MFEVTESTELKDLEATNKVLQKIRSFGCHISIDDFGAGSAAFNYLKMLEVDYVKIDGSYILDAFRTRHGRPFLRAIAQLSRDMGLKTIGEMVEDQRTMALLEDVGVDYGQGYFFGRPMQEVISFQLPTKPDRRRANV
jgi:EAL domain-containing protein (putative c-di-GMP-specific phosphodiesterase class I)